MGREGKPASRNMNQYVRNRRLKLRGFSVSMDLGCGSSISASANFVMKNHSYSSFSIMFYPLRSLISSCWCVLIQMHLYIQKCLFLPIN